MGESIKKYNFSASNYMKNSIAKYILIFFAITLPFTLIAILVKANVLLSFAFIGIFTALVEIGVMVSRTIAYKKGFIEITPTYIRYYNVKSDGYTDDLRTYKVFESDDYVTETIDSINVINNRIQIKGRINLIAQKKVNGELKKNETKVLTTCTINPYYDNWKELKKEILNIKKDNQ